MGCPSQCILGENLVFSAQARDGTGAPADADGNVSYSVYEAETATAILTGTMANLASQTGFYSESIGCTTANGFERYKTYTVRITAAINSISVAKLYSFICVSGEDYAGTTTDALTSTANFKTYAGITSSDNDTLIASLIARATSAIESYCCKALVSATHREVLDGSGLNYIALNHYPIQSVGYLSFGRQSALIITNTNSDAYMAVINITSTEMTLVVSGGANAGTDTLTLADYTITELNTAINALGTGWESSLYVSDVGVWESAELLEVSGLNTLDVNAYVELPEEPADDFTFDADMGVLNTAGTITEGTQNVICKYTAGYSTTPADLEQICIDLVNYYYQGRSNDTSVMSKEIGDYSVRYSKDSKSMPDSIKTRLAKYKRFLV